MALRSYGLTDFINDIQPQYVVGRPDTFWPCEAAVRQLLAGDVVRNWLNEQLRALLRDPLHVGSWSPKEAVLHRGGGWTLSIAMFDTPQRFVHALPFQAIYAPLASDLVGDRYRLPEGFRNDVFDPGLRLEPAGPISVAQGETLRLETDKYAYDFHVSRAVPVLRFVTDSIRPLEWLFSKSVLQAWQANDSDLNFTQLRVAAFVLGKIAHQSSIPPLRQLASHPHHAVRWAAIQNLGRLSRSEALTKIREAVNDPHPHVRRAAQKTLEQLDKRTQR